MKKNQDRLWMLAALMLLPFTINAMGLQEPYKVINQSGSIRAKVPTWFNNPGRTAIERDFPDYYAYVVKRTGKNLRPLQLFANKDVGSLVAQEISLEVVDIVNTKLKSSIILDESFVTEYLANLSTSISKARIVGLRKEQDWWIEKMFVLEARDGDIEYDYGVLYLVDITTIKNLIKKVSVDSIPQNVDPDLQAKVEALMKTFTDESF